MNTAMTFCLLLAVPRSACVEALAPTPRRLAPIHLKSGAVLLVDDYKTVLETVYAALDTLKIFPRKKKVLILGEIFEPPGATDVVYRNVGRRAACVSNMIVFVGPRSLFENLAKGAAEAGKNAYHASGGVIEAARLAKGMMTTDTVVLLKGSGFQRFERIALLLAKRSATCNRALCPASLTWPCSTCRHLTT